MVGEVAGVELGEEAQRPLARERQGIVSGTPPTLTPRRGAGTMANEMTGGTARGNRWLAHSVVPSPPRHTTKSTKLWTSASAPLRHVSTSISLVDGAARRSSATTGSTMTATPWSCAGDRDGV